MERREDVEALCRPLLYADTFDGDDPAVSPAHYIAGTMEVINVIEAFTDGLNGIEAACTANIIKYACRWKRKNGVQDLKKLVWYAQHLIDILEEKGNGNDV